ncbi:MAG: arginine--tRNA ligase [Candidatus Glassbacteria bacterium RIFCSPLOWO2_12_FULL_58_11]|uniref:Arginine--tRNA ligase n=1 Tax=Candidatus Glassbacteria bacterium RIFCSPLOWO2_12_FULL_58_11 TaxID=1817867 RepID=A0A1F5YK74_9BACT|nr:MAG: arginine--tRNA ligase [Candidatus Glassbacteria bacterium RIFCSPLOWO2_12_FULL_58_11]
MEKIIRQAVDRALAELHIEDAPEYVIEKPRDPAHGDLATNVAFLLARTLKKKPALIAGEIAGALKLESAPVERVEVAPNGFINFRISPRWNIELLARVQKEGERYGLSDCLAGKKIVVEFVSSNPTGPLTVGHGRQAVLGDCISSLLEALGAKVCREYYYNDAGNQMNMLGRSLRARYARLFDPAFSFPENGYQGEYLIEIAQAFAAEHGERFRPGSAAEEPGPETMKIFREYAAEKIRRMIDADLKLFKINFDVWSMESRLYSEGKVEELLALLEKRGISYRKDGAVWLAASRFGDSEDRVIVKSSGEPTYFLPDLAYHLVKFERSFDVAINIHGADHHGYAPRMQAGMRALGYPEGWLRYVIHQMVSFIENGEQVRMSTRAGRFVTLADLCREVGVDVARYFFVMRKADSHLVFDLDLARKQSNENPVYYCQYVHARICSLTPTAVEAGFWDGERGRWKEYTPGALTQPEETELIAHLVEFPSLVRTAGEALEPHHIPYYLEELAKKFHSWYQHHRIVVAGEKELSLDRLYLADCVRRVMANGLRLLGITAPEKM